MSKQQFDDFIEQLCIVSSGIKYDFYPSGYNFHRAFDAVSGHIGPLREDTINQLRFVVGNVMGSVAKLKPEHVRAMMDTMAVSLPFMVWKHKCWNNQVADYRGPRIRWCNGKVVSQ